MISMQQYERDNLQAWTLQGLLSWPSFYLHCGARTGEFSCQKPANVAPLALYPNPVVYALIAVFQYAAGTIYKQVLGLVLQLGLPIIDFLKDCMWIRMLQNDMLQRFRRPCTQLVPGTSQPLLQWGYKRQSASLCCSGSTVVVLVLSWLCRRQCACCRPTLHPTTYRSPFGSLLWSPHLLLGPYIPWGQYLCIWCECFIGLEYFSSKCLVMKPQEWSDQQANCSPELQTDHPICCIGSLHGMVGFSGFGRSSMISLRVARGTGSNAATRRGLRGPKDA